MKNTTVTTPYETNTAPIYWSHPNVWAFFGIHLMGIAALWMPLSPKVIGLTLATFWIRMWFITGGYHRYFSHRAYKTNRIFQFILGFLATTSAQKGPIWWASHHRIHHRYSDTPKDVHTPWYGGGFFWSHVGWIISPKWEHTDEEQVKDWLKYPELRWIDKNMLVPPMLLGIFTYLIGGFPGLMWGFFFSTTLLFHATFTINSFNHRFGTQRYKTTDTSRNHWFFAILTLGEGWHNNHHYYQSAARNGFYWWEYDVTYYVLKALSWLGIVRDLKTVPLAVREANHYAPGEQRLLRIDPIAVQAKAEVQASSAMEAANRAMERAQAAAQRAKDGTDEKAHQWAESAREAAHRATEAASEAAHRAKESFTVAAGHAVEAYHEKAHQFAQAANEAAANVAALFAQEPQVA